MIMPLFHPPDNLPSNNFRLLRSSSSLEFRRQIRLRLAFLFKTRRKDICWEITTDIDIVEQTFLAQGIGQHTNSGLCGSIGCVAWDYGKCKERRSEHDMSFGCVDWQG